LNAHEQISFLLQPEQLQMMLLPGNIILQKRKDVHAIPSGGLTKEGIFENPLDRMDPWCYSKDGKKPE
jgi:hypothetical protein